MDASSRYANVGTRTRVEPDGTVITYYQRRFLPRFEGPTGATVRARPGERLDQVAARVLGDPLQYYRICDAQRGVLNPFELVRDAGNRLPVPPLAPEVPSLPLAGAYEALAAAVTSTTPNGAGGKSK